ncbi:MAG: alpha/beta hydrolase [bacterium]|nr:alpha/beta hydrolase [bacterium]
MSKRVFIIHGWGGKPDEHWIPWLKSQLEAKGFEVLVPAMPDTDEPIIDKWVNRLSEIVGELDEQTNFIGHSIGCQTIMRYLATQEGKKAGTCVFIAGWFKLENLESAEEERIAAPWLKDDIDFQKVLSVTKKFIVINSSNDNYGAVTENQNLFEQNLGAKVTILPNKGHFTAVDGIIKLPEVLAALSV